MTQAADRARERILSAWLQANPNQPMREGMDEVRAMLDAIEHDADAIGGLSAAINGWPEPQPEFDALRDAAQAFFDVASETYTVGDSRWPTRYDQARAALGRVLATQNLR